jgi:sugar lactone lactonase YvrE
VKQRDITALDVEASLLGESPLWHAREHALYWCDIPGFKLNRFVPATGKHDQWGFETDLACCAAMRDGGLLLAMRDGLWRFDTATGQRSALAAPPYDPARERFNDGKCDPRGRFWVGTIYEPRDPALAALYRFDGRALERMAGDVTNSNGLGWSPDGRTMYWTDTKAHTIYALDFDAQKGVAGERRAWASFAMKRADQPLTEYGGRPDGGAVDAEGAYWAAMFEGQRLVRLSPSGQVLEEVALPVRCPTMPCFGGADMRTLYVTTARQNRPADELSQQPLAGRVLSLRVDIPGVPIAEYA